METLAPMIIHGAYPIFFAFLLAILTILTVNWIHRRAFEKYGLNEPNMWDMHIFMYIIIMVTFAVACLMAMGNEPIKTMIVTLSAPVLFLLIVFVLYWENKYKKNAAYMKELHEKEIVECWKAIDFDPSNAAAYFHLGEIHEKMKLISEARKYFKKSLELEPNPIEQSKIASILKNL